MAYDRYDSRQGPRGERPRWSDERNDPRGGRDDRGGREEPGFFERAGNQIASWFGDEEDAHRDERDQRDRDYGRGRGSERGQDRGWDAGRGGRERERMGREERERMPRDERDYRPLTGDYGRAEGFFAAAGASGMDRGERGSPDRGRDEYRRPAPPRAEHPDPHYHEWRQRQISALDRDYDEYRREHQSKFESDFGNWRDQRQTKRQMLGQIREQMEVVGSDDQHVGTIDRVAGDRLILTKSDPAAGGTHHSLSCSELERVEDNRVILGATADQARQRWRDENRDRALFEREDQGQSGPHMLDRSFSGTYR
jgi:hypothetical protein